MVQIGWYEVFGTVLLVIFVVVVVLLFVFIGWFVVWKLILSHFRFFREIFGMENGNGNDKKYPGTSQPVRGSASLISPETPAHIRRRMERLSGSNSAAS